MEVKEEGVGGMEEGGKSGRGLEGGRNGVKGGGVGVRENGGERRRG